MSDKDYDSLKNLVITISKKLFEKYKAIEDDGANVVNQVKGEIHSAVGVGIYEAEIEYFL